MLVLERPPGQEHRWSPCRVNGQGITAADVLDLFFTLSRVERFSLLAPRRTSFIIFSCIISILDYEKSSRVIGNIRKMLKYIVFMCNFWTDRGSYNEEL
jgi:hypothetical protein